MTTKEKLTAIFESGHSFIIQNQVRRQDGEWHTRIVWQHVQLPSNQTIKSCDWFGFEDIDECADDCLKYIASIKNEE
jgi:hypothetical protein